MSTKLSQLFLILTFISYCLCAGLRENESGSSNLEGDLSGNDFQKWNDFKKKNFISSGTPFGSGDKFQQWNDWRLKRGLGMSGGDDFGGLDKAQFQRWQDWIAKRQFTFKPTFGQGPDGKDFITKDGKIFNSPADVFGPGFGNRDGFQSWEDLVKRHNLMFPASGLSMSDNPNFQNWQDWIKKRSVDFPIAYGIYGFGNGPHPVSWYDMWQKRAQKRQLGFAPDNFGTFRGYFIDGLQDWRSTFKGAKRNKEESE